MATTDPTPELTAARHDELAARYHPDKAAARAADLERTIVRALGDHEFADELRQLHHRHVTLDANARHLIARQVLDALGVEWVGVATEAGIGSGTDFIVTPHLSPGDIDLYRLRADTARSHPSST